MPNLNIRSALYLIYITINIKVKAKQKQVLTTIIKPHNLKWLIFNINYFLIFHLPLGINLHGLERNITLTYF